MAPRWPQDGPKRPPRSPQEGPKRPQEAPPRHSRRPRAPQNRQEAPQTSQDAFKNRPRDIPRGTERQSRDTWPFCSPSSAGSPIIIILIVIIFRLLLLFLFLFLRLILLIIILLFFPPATPIIYPYGLLCRLILCTDRLSFSLFPHFPDLFNLSGHRFWMGWLSDVTRLDFRGTQHAQRGIEPAKRHPKRHREALHSRGFWPSPRSIAFKRLLPLLLSPTYPRCHHHSPSSP